MTNKIKELSEKIKRRNRDFAKLTKPQQRVAIARDVIAALNAKKIIAKNRVYIQNAILDNLIHKNPDEQVCNLMEQVPSCNVCVKGALFVAAVKRKDKLQAKDMLFDDEPWITRLEDEESISKYLGTDNLFSKAQLTMIEDQFEKDTIVDWENENFRIWRGDIQTADGRMRAIMQNIIKNKGTFRPKKSEMAKIDN